MLHDFDKINSILASMEDNGMVEPIDDPSVMCDFYDWADVVGVDIDEWIPVEYTV